jgi:hypothetical protein
VLSRLDAVSGLSGWVLWLVYWGALVILWLLLLDRGGRLDDLDD